MEKISKWSLSVPVMEDESIHLSIFRQNMSGIMCTVHLQPATTLVFTREAAQMFFVSTSDQQAISRKVWIGFPLYYGIYSSACSSFQQAANKIIFKKTSEDTF